MFWVLPIQGVQEVDDLNEKSDMPHIVHTVMMVA